MALKKLNQFNYFDAEGFFSKLKLITVGSTVWKEYGSNVVKGTKLEVVIASDKHRYNSNEGEVVNNMYEKLTVKLPKEMDVPMNVEVKLINPEASIYGEYRNQLSIVAEDVLEQGRYTDAVDDVLCKVLAAKKKHNLFI